MPEPALAGLAADATPDQVSAYAESDLAGFLATEVNPGAPQREEDREVVPRAAFTAASRAGLLNYLLPREVGGLGGSRRVFGLLLEQMGHLCDDMAFPSCFPCTRTSRPSCWPPVGPAWWSVMS